MRTPTLGLLVGAIGWTACAGETESSAPPPPLPDVAVDTAPLRRLTAVQYRHAIEDIFGAGLVLPTALEPDLSAGGLLALGAARNAVSAWGVEQYEAAAYDIAEQILDDPARRDAWVPCPASGGEGCAALLVRDAGLRLWRRPLEDAEVEALVRVAEEAATALGTFDDGLVYAMAGLLQSPYFLYRHELAEDRFDDWALASRLSFFLWNTTPDEALLDAAAQGRLTTPEGLEAEVDRLLADARARQGVRNFFSELYHLYELDEMVKDPTLFVHFDTELGSDARQETLQVIEDLIFEQDGDYRDLMTTPKTFVNRRLAAVYRVPAPAREAFGAVELPAESGRRGLLGHISTLALHSHPAGSSAVLRGHFVRTVLLCGVIPPPPVGVNTALPEPSADAPTLRARNAVHLEAPECANCHQLMDPIGLGLENFDGLGRFRAEDNGARIDASGDLDGTPFADGYELAEALRNHPRLPSCLVRHLYAYAVGDEASGAENMTVNGLTDRFAAQGYRVKALLHDIATSAAFTRVEGGAR